MVAVRVDGEATFKNFDRVDQRNELENGGRRASVVANTYGFYPNDFVAAIDDDARHTIEVLQDDQVIDTLDNVRFQRYDKTTLGSEIIGSVHMEIVSEPESGEE